MVLIYEKVQSCYAKAEKAKKSPNVSQGYRVILNLTKACYVQIEQGLHRHKVIKSTTGIRSIGTKWPQQRIHGIDTCVPCSILFTDKEHQVARHCIFLRHLYKVPFSRICHKAVTVAGTMVFVVKRCSSIDTRQWFPTAIGKIFAVGST